ncbi:hypothetical protein QN345_00140 [Cryobacterium sp. 10I1]|uniref:hypothetical protein n=1 Tax=unclassified Cryobacterium TaxID=2649013 RepID=UPI002AC9BF50|nr:MULTISPECIES: hypothetical protein [unclassified Cryobacterium]MEB0286776.1 hypothetical protein [Cryobacterium sp. 10S3]MEB0303747.1 hypothetical protein [Cryobacterium sp. 10I1]WPX12674.1 hypothetical protein RHM57_13440 [Cryobacterium sp. 10S3]
MSIAEPALMVSMSDIAALARVQRPVVSVWRSRSALTDTPFPAPAAVRNGRELFDAHAVGTWLHDTGHGNNPQASADAAAHAVLDGQTHTQADTFRKVTALLALRSVIGRSLGVLTGSDLVDAADEHDPDDDAFYREIEAIGAECAGLVGYVDALVEAAYGEAEAFERLLADRFKREPQGASDTTLNDLGLDLIARTALALAATQPSEPAFVDATGGASDVLLAIARTESASGDVTVLTANDDSDTARLVRRRLLVHRIARDGLEIQPSGAFSVTGRAVHVAQLPSANEPRMSATDMLSAVEQIVLQMDDDQLAVILAPSAVLSDSGLARDTDAVRSSLLRSGRVRAIVRLPAGLLTYKPQQVQTLWVLGAAHARVPLADRWTMVADLSAQRLNPTAIEDLVSDLVASLGDRVTVRAHAFRFARLVLTRTLLASRDSLVAGAHIAACAASSTRGTELAVRVDELLRALNDPASEVPPVGEATTASDTPVRSVGLAITLPPISADNAASSVAQPTTASVEQLLAGRHLRYFPGNRIDGADLNETPRGDAGAPATGTRSTGIRVIGLAEVRGEAAVGDRRIDPLLFATDYPAGRVTEPGDVIFCTAPTPAAIVDENGTSAVLFPARILRINPGNPNGLLSAVLAADIAALAAGDRRWRRWPLRQIPDAQGAALARILASLRLEQEHARRRLAQLDELAGLLMAGVTAGTLTLSQAAGLQNSSSFAPPEGTP